MTSKKIVIPRKFVIIGILLSPMLIIYLWYPKIAFDLKQINDSIYVPDTLHAPYGFRIRFYAEAVSSWKDNVTTVFFSDKSCEKIDVRNALFEWEGGTGLWGEGAYEITGVQWEKSTRDQDWYVSYVEGISNVNLHKIFKGKKLGDEFNFALRFIYSIDDGPEILQIINYHVLVCKDTLRLPMLFGIP